MGKDFHFHRYDFDTRFNLKTFSSEYGAPYFNTCHGLQRERQWFCGHLRNYRFNNQNRTVSQTDRLYRTMVNRLTETEYVSKCDRLFRFAIFH